MIHPPITLDPTSLPLQVLLPPGADHGQQHGRDHGCGCGPEHLWRVSCDVFGDRGPRVPGHWDPGHGCDGGNLRQRHFCQPRHQWHSGREKVVGDRGRCDTQARDRLGGGRETCVRVLVKNTQMPVWGYELRLPLVTTTRGALYMSFCTLSTFPPSPLPLSPY